MLRTGISPSVELHLGADGWEPGDVLGEPGTESAVIRIAHDRHVL
ncbi:hypothetical protein JOD24_000041 [Kroppenstedtia sanguinis]